MRIDERLMCLRCLQFSGTQEVANMDDFMDVLPEVPTVLRYALVY